MVKHCPDETFSEKEWKILKLGLKTNFIPSKIQIEEIIVRTELGIKKVDFQNQDLTRKKWLKILQKTSNKTVSGDGHTFKLIQRLNNNLLFLSKFGPRELHNNVNSKSEYFKRVVNLIESEPM